MHKLTWLAALVFLAGCSGPAATDPGVAPEGAAVITDPRNLSYNGTAGHVHDYWGGKDSMKVVSEQGANHVAQSSEGVVAGRFLPAEGTIVPQGTGRLEAAASWELQDVGSTVPPSVPSDFDLMELWVQTASDSEPHKIGVIENGGQITFNATNEQDDPPHYVLSLWQFELRAFKQDGSAATFNGRSTLDVMAYRTLELPIFPPHVDRWAGASELVLVDESYNVASHVTAYSFSICNGCLPTITPGTGLVVPHDATEVQVTVEVATGSTPVPLGLQAHGADTRTFAAASTDSTPLGPQVYHIQVDGNGDSPYAKQSLWEFVLHMATPEESGAWRGDVSVEIKAIR